MLAREAVAIPHHVVLDRDELPRDLHFGTPGILLHGLSFGLPSALPRGVGSDICRFLLALVLADTMPNESVISAIPRHSWSTSQSPRTRCGPSVGREEREVVRVVIGGGYDPGQPFHESYCECARKARTGYAGVAE